MSTQPVVDSAALGDGTGHHSTSTPKGRYLALLSLTALGVVYGDIGTSPLYAMRESFHYYHLEPTRTNVFGVLSLIFWSLILVISIKYAIFVLRADNGGEGGILALTALVTPVGASHRGGRRILIMLGLFGTALLYGDGMITPVVSVLGALDGAFLVLGSVFLVVTGGEALYADLGHFGRRPIRVAWFALVLPALLLNYFGQGALLLRNPAAVENPFFLLAPDWALLPLVALATAAAILASQAD